MTGKRRPIGGGSAKGDASVTADEYEDNPEWTERDFARAVPHVGGRRVSLAEFRKKVSRMGRPPSSNPKKAVNLRLDADVVAHFRKGGPGWQTRVNAALRRAARLPKQAKRA